MTGLSFLELDERNDAFGVLLARSTAQPALSNQEVESLRQAFYRDGRFDQRTASEIFHTNRTMPAQGDAWVEFYLEALTGFFLDQNRRGHRLSAQSEATLLDWLGDAVPIANLAERRLLARVMFRTSDASDGFERFVFASFRHHLLHESERWLGGQFGRSAGIDAMDLQLIRRLVLRCQDFLPARVSAAAFGFLIDLDRQAARFSEPHAWLDLLVEGAARYLSDRSLTMLEPASTPVLDAGVSASIERSLRENRQPNEAADLHGRILMTATHILEASCTQRQAQDHPVGE